MTTLDLAQHPELAALCAAVRAGEVVLVTDHGQLLAQVLPAPAGQPLLRSRLESLQHSLSSPAYPGNSVVDMRRETA